MEEKWTIRHQAARGRIFIVAEGYATAQKSQDAALEFTQALGSNTVELVIDLDKMTGYTSEARQVWQECFTPVRRQLRRMVVIGQKLPAIVRMGVTVVAAVTGVSVTFHKTLEEADRGAFKRSARE